MTATMRGRVRPDPDWPTHLTVLHADVDDLTVDYDDAITTDRRPLLARLDDLQRRTVQPADLVDTGGLRSQPASRPPGSLDAVSHARVIRDGAVRLDMWLRRSRITRPWPVALDSLPYLAEQKHELGLVSADVGRWHSMARTVLGLQPPARGYDAACRFCGARSLKGRTDPATLTAGAWCSNRDCVDPGTGRRPTYDHGQLLLLAADRKADHT